METSQKTATELKMTLVNKSFTGVSVLNDVTLQAQGGEILALLGQNGAGKSTLMKILAGIHPHGSYKGEITLDGEAYRPQSLLEAEKCGVVMIPQEIEICENLNVAETLYISELSSGMFINWNALFTKARNDLERFGITDISPDCPMSLLTKSQHQLILIAKAFSQTSGNGASRVLILDEPTASLSEKESQILFGHLEKAKRAGMICIYISHRLKEVFDISDKFAIMRDGRMIGTYGKDEISMDEAIAQIVGAKLTTARRASGATFGKTVLQVDHLDVYTTGVGRRKAVDGVSFQLHEGEVLGVFGHLGSGKTEIAMSVYGAWKGDYSCEMQVDGKPVRLASAKEAIDAGISFLPEDRRLAMFEQRSIKENMVIIFLNKLRNALHLLNGQKENQVTKELQGRLRLKTPSLDNLPATLSGGNKQKVLFSRMLGNNSRILIVDEPTVGVDVNTRQDIYGILTGLAREQRCAVLFFSSDIEEIVQVSDQIMVLRGGKVVRFFDQTEIQTSNINADVVLKAAVS